MKINEPVTQVEESYSSSANILSTTNSKGIISYVNKDFIDISGGLMHTSPPRLKITGNWSINPSDANPHPSV